MFTFTRGALDRFAPVDESGENIVREARSELLAAEQWISELEKRLNEQAAILRKPSELSRIWSDRGTRRVQLLEKLGSAVADGMVSAAKQEAKRPNGLDYDRLQSFTFESHISDLSTADPADTTPDTGDDSMEFLIDLLSDAIDRAHIRFAPASESSKVLVDFFNSASASTESSSSPPTGITPGQSRAFEKYQDAKERALSTVAALLLRCVDSRYVWPAGYLMALETKRLAASTRLSLLVSKLIPAPTGTALINALGAQVARQEANRKSLKEMHTIRLATFDNISSAYGYVRKSTASGIAQKNRKNSIATAWSIHHHTLTPAGQDHFASEKSSLRVSSTNVVMNPQLLDENIPRNSVTEAPDNFWLLTPEELEILEADWKGSLKIALEAFNATGEEVELEPAAAGGAVIGEKKIVCVTCFKEWHASKRICRPGGCGNRIRGIVAVDVSGVTEFDAPVPRCQQTREIKISGGGRASRAAAVSWEASSKIMPPPQDDWLHRTEDIQEMLMYNPGAKIANAEILNIIGQRNDLQGFVADADGNYKTIFLCSDGGADRMLRDYAGHFGPHGNIVPVIASGHELMNMLKALMKIAYQLGADKFAEIHTWTSLKAKMTLMGCSDTHKSIAFLLSVCRPAMETCFVMEWLAHLKKTSTNFDVDRTNVNLLWSWVTGADAKSDQHFSNHVHFWIKTLGALALLRKGLRSKKRDPVHSHALYRCAQKFLVDYFFALGNSTWGPLVLRDFEVIDYIISEQLREVYLEMFRIDLEGFDFLQEHSVREIGRNMLLSATALSFKIGALARANGPVLSSHLSSIVGVTDRGKRQRTEVSYFLDKEGCVHHVMKQRSLEMVLDRTKVYNVSLDLTKTLPAQTTPIALSAYGAAGIVAYVAATKDGNKNPPYPESHLAAKKVAIYMDSDDEDD